MQGLVKIIRQKILNLSGYFGHVLGVTSSPLACCRFLCRLGLKSNNPRPKPPDQCSPIAAPSPATIACGKDVVGVRGLIEFVFRVCL